MTSLLRLLTWHLGSQIVGADSDVRGVDSSAGSVGHSVRKSGTSDNTAVGVGDAVGMGAVVSSVAGEAGEAIGEAGIQESGVGIGFSIGIGITLLASTGDGHVPGVHARGGLAEGVAVAVVAEVAVAVAVVAEAVAVAVVAVVGIGISIGGDSSHKGGEEDKELHDDDAAL